MCRNGHDTSLYHRKDGECGKCHQNRQRRYEATYKGRMYLMNREHKPERKYNKVRTALRANIVAKKKKISELERMLG